MTGTYQILLAPLLSSHFKAQKLFSLLPQSLQMGLDLFLNKWKCFGWFDFYFDRSECVCVGGVGGNLFNP